MSDIGDLKEKFATVQSINQSLKEDKIRLESEIKTLKENYDAKLKQLLEETGTSSYEEAVEYCKKQKEILDKDVAELDEKLSNYLDTYGEESDE